MTNLVIILAIIVLLIIFFLQKITISIVYDDVFLVFLKFGFIKINLLKKNEKSDSNENIKQSKDNTAEANNHVFKEIYEFLKFILPRIKNKIVVKKLDLSVDFGLFDAAQTAILTGAIWSAVYNLFGLLDSYTIVKDHNFIVNPVFNQEIMKAKLEGIFNVRLAHIMYACILIITKKFFIRGA